MKKMIRAILLFDFIAGLLFLTIEGMRDMAVASDSGIVRIDGGMDLEMEDVKKVAITFDGESIIRLSQENCLKEAVSMI